jgi:hypothetical protein
VSHSVHLFLSKTAPILLQEFSAAKPRELFPRQAVEGLDERIF